MQFLSLGDVFVVSAMTVAIMRVEIALFIIVGLI